jgi:hypothetical protein
MADLVHFVRLETAFDPEFVQVLASALDDAWDKVQKSGSVFARALDKLGRRLELRPRKRWRTSNLARQ